MRELEFTYKLGLAVMATAVMIFVFSGILGGIVHKAGLGILELLDAPAERGFFPQDEPETGSEVLMFVGLLTLATGASAVSFRYLFSAAERMLRLTRKPGLIDRLGRIDQVGLAAAAIGLLLVISGGIPEHLLINIFLYGEGGASDESGTIETLEALRKLGQIIFFPAIAVLILGGVRRRAAVWGFVLWVVVVFAACIKAVVRRVA